MRFSSRSRENVALTLAAYRSSSAASLDCDAIFWTFMPRLNVPFCSVYPNPNSSALMARLRQRDGATGYAMPRRTPDRSQVADNRSNGELKTSRLRAGLDSVLLGPRARRTPFPDTRHRSLSSVVEVDVFPRD
jgi:hypothetical protein